MTKREKQDFYVDRLIHDWQLDGQSKLFQTRVRKVLREMHTEAQLALVGERRLEIKITAERVSVWAYFPMSPGLQKPKLKIPAPSTEDELRSAIRSAEDDIYRRRLIAQTHKPAPATQVLLVFNPAFFESQPARKSADELRDHLGHTLLYLRNPKARNECADAWREWDDNLAECPESLLKKK